MQTVIGIDDTDSRERGMCTTYAARLVARRLRERGHRVSEIRLVRLNPAVEHKTRGNAALAIHTAAPPAVAFDAATGVVNETAETDDERTNPGVVVATAVDEPVVAFAADAVSTFHTIEDADRLVAERDYRSAGWGVGRGKIGALAAVGAHAAFDDWTYEYIAYRDPDRWGTPRDVDVDSLFAAADAAYPGAWDTVDRGEGAPVCVPNAPGPILYGIRGDDPVALARVAAGVESEPVHDRALFVTNQGTDVHVQPGKLGDLSEGRAYRLTADVVEAPETGPGGHVFFAVGDGDERLACVAFEPTKRFRDRVRDLRVGDRVTVVGEVTDGTLKLEKFAVRDLQETTLATPTCPTCGRSMESAGADQGYRCRDCGTSAPGRVEVPVSRDLEAGWYEVPPVARRHVAKPLIRGGFDAPTHPER
ncbi:tRNA(Ile2) 2-agmatinylcytidine synthetase [Halanaeroarchaeum sp. HSR-CO]|uniref:tRNA(Ile)(2)-agmatinylcytidine synthase n=1 Tax=Halanaeroarchaeum sp. HSR-CO TaxID=2866382 RepID=UPI0037BF4AE6|nr:tRNA(Ile2) 2-agmatinylcytidine synthetase [Halanaeroarchaeum sp. HSR-CO]